jgi:hypothetical protein
VFELTSVRESVADPQVLGRMRVDGLSLEGALLAAAVGGLVGFAVGYLQKMNDVDIVWALAGWGLATIFLLATLGFVATGRAENTGDIGSRLALSVGKVFGGYGVAATIAGVLGGVLGVGAAEDQKNKVR